jgi:hypothetical protein
VAESFAPDEATARFEMKGALSQFWPYLLFGGLATLGAVASVVNPSLAGKPSLNPQSLCLGGIGLILLGIAGRKNWWRVKWVEAANRSGIRWSAYGRVWEHTWEQLERIDVQASRVDVGGGTELIGDHRTTVTFSDGAEFYLRARECDQYVVLLKYLEAKHQQTAAARLVAHYAASLPEHQKAAAGGEVTTFGPLGVYRGGVEWDGIYFPWEQLEGFAVENGMLLVRTLDGDEFLRRLADLGDWQTAVERLLDAADKMCEGRGAPQPETTPDGTLTAPPPAAAP